MFTELLVWWMNLFDKNDTKNFIQGLFWLFYRSGVDFKGGVSILDDSTVGYSHYLLSMICSYVN